MADEVQGGAWINVIVGVLIVAATALSHNLRDAQLYFSVIVGLALAALSAFTSATWARSTRARRAGLAIGAALLGVVLLVEWWTEDEPVSLRAILMLLGLVAAVVGAIAAYRAQRDPSP